MTANEAIGSRIKARRLELNITQKELAKRAGYTSHTSIAKIEKGGVDLPQSKILVFANALSTTVDYIMGWGDHSDRTNPSVILSEEIDIPEIATVSAGFDKMPLSNFEYDRFSIPRSYLCGHDPQDCFIIRVKGDSMYPLYVDGDRVLARRSDALDYSGQIGLVQDGETATIKKVEFGNGWIRLVPVNPVYTPRTIRGQDLEQVRIIGIPMILIRELMEK